jgi:hypothetical protein
MAKPPATKPDTSGAGAAVRVEPRTPQILKWDPAKIVQARLRASYGDFSLFSDLCEAMMPDDRVSQALEKIYSAVTLPLTFQLPGMDAEQSKNDPVCQALDTDFWKFLPEHIARTALTWIALANCALLHIDGWRLDTETGRTLPVMSCWSLRHLRNDPVLGWVVRTASPGSYDSYGVEETVVPGDGNWIILLSGSSWKAISQARGHGVALFWLLKQYAIIDWASSSERHGQGTNVASCTSDLGKGLLAKDRVNLASDMATMARNGNLVMPPGWEYSLATDDANSYATFEAQIKAADSGATIGITGTNLTTEVTGGSRAAATVHETMDASRMRGILEFLATGLREQLLTWWHRFNFALGIVPYPHWDTTPPADKKAEAEARLADSQALKNYVEGGLRPSRKAWAQRAVIEVGEGDDAILPSAKPVPTEPQIPGKKSARALGKGESEPLAFERGLEYVGKVETSLCKHAAKALSPTLASVLAAIEKSTSYDEAQQAIVDAFGDAAPPSMLCRLTESAILMAQLAGAESVERELDEA